MGCDGLLIGETAPKLIESLFILITVYLDLLLFLLLVFCLIFIISPPKKTFSFIVLKLSGVTILSLESLLKRVPIYITFLGFYYGFKF
jgi:hypothetical protein